MLMATTHVGHDCVIGNGVSITCGTVLAGHARIDDGVFLSGNVFVHQFCRIGRISIVGGNRRAVRDVPPFVVVNADDGISGVNVVGLRRAGIDESARKELVRMVGKLRSSDEPVAELARSFEPKTPEGREFVDALSNDGKRGTLPFVRVSKR